MNYFVWNTSLSLQHKQRPISDLAQSANGVPISDLAQRANSTAISDLAQSANGAPISDLAKTAHGIPMGGEVLATALDKRRLFSREEWGI